MSVRASFLPAAQREVDEVVAWYLERSAQAALGFVREIERAMTLISASPKLWPLFESGTRRYPLARYP